MATAVTIGCVAVVVITVAALAMPSLRARLGFAPARSASYSAGQRIDVPANLYDSSPLTLFVFARSSCGACQRAKPLFADIARRLSNPSSVRVLLVNSSTRREDEASYARDLGLDESHLVTLNGAGLRLQVVPTLVLVDRLGEIHYASEGVPTAAQEDDLLRAVASAATPR
jgi:thiol-disulfide isomerase/thioredoxin